MKDLIELMDDYMCEKTDFILATEFYREQYSYYVIKEKKQYWIITYANREDVYITLSINDEFIKEADIRTIEELEEFIKDIY